MQVVVRIKIDCLLRDILIYHLSIRSKQYGLYYLLMHVIII